MPATKSLLNTNSIKDQVQEVLTWLKNNSSKKILDGMARYGLPSDKAFGIRVGTLQKHAKDLGRNHELALALWKTGWYETRMLAVFLDDPALVTPEQMDQWTRDFDSWGICDTACFHLFDRTPHAFGKIKQWSRSREEFVKRAAFALLASVALHDKKTGDSTFFKCLPLIEKAAADERNFVKKGVSWALRLVGRRSLKLHQASMQLAARLAASSQSAERWIGKDALRDLGKPAVLRRLKAQPRV